MSESQGHKRAKREAAGKSGKTEVPLKSGQRLDAITKKKRLKLREAEQSKD